MKKVIFSFAIAVIMTGCGNPLKMRENKMLVHPMGKEEQIELPNADDHKKGDLIMIGTQIYEVDSVYVKYP